MKVTVLRLGHRHARDKRLTTHVGLVARAFGAKELVLDIKDKEVKESIEEVVEAWGGEFLVSFIEDWKKYIRDFRGQRIHLTMYGLSLNGIEGELRENREDKLVVVGGRKVPSEVYELVDYNVAVGHQPHSEAAALAVLLDRLFKGEELRREFPGGKRIIPQAKGKKVVERR